LLNYLSGDGKGHSGIDMTRYAPGPCLVKNVQIQGFDYGILVGNHEYGPTFENITLKNQNAVGIYNTDNALAIRKLQSTNSGAVIQNQGEGLVIVLDGNFQGGSSTLSAIQNNGYLYARNIVANGYQSAINTKGTVVPGASQSEYVSNKIYSLFSSPKKSLNLTIRETPVFHDNNTANWGKFTPSYYGDTDPLQSLLNSGKSTIYFPHGVYFSYNKKVVTVPATVKRIVGFGSGINEGPDGGGVVFSVEENSDQPLIIEQFGGGVSVEHASARTVAMKHGNYGYTDFAGAGRLFLEDVVLGTLNLNHSHSVWARQLDTESSNGAPTKITNQGATLWILGIKTEGKGTVINTSAGGRTELLGTLIYPAQQFTADEQQYAAFVNNESSQSLIYALSVYDPSSNYNVQVQETRGGVTRQFLTKNMPSRMPLFVGYK